MAIWDAVKELERLQRKAAEGKDIEDKDTFQVRAALKEKGWEGLVCEEAISRGYKKFRGEEVDFPSWYIADSILPTPPEVQGSEAPKEKQDVSRRLFNLLGGIPGEESEEQEEVCEEGLEEPPYAGIGLSKEAQLAALEEETSGPPFPGSEDDLNLAEFRRIFGPTQKEETMEKAIQLEEKVSGTRQRVHVGDEIGWICKPCNRVWGLDEITCPSCDGEPGYETVFPAAKQAADKAIVLALGKKKDDKDLAIEAMHKALGISVEYPEGVQEISIIGVGDEEDDTVQCDHCGGNDYLECDCCLECESEECVCCDNCARFPCQCDKEECPICQAQMPIAEACPNGCDSDIKELQQLYEDVKDSKDFNFKEKLKFMSLLKEKISLASDIAGPNEHNDEDDPEAYEDEPLED